MDKKQVLDLENPAMHYRPVPFWSWNEALEDAELLRQINLMCDAHMGGYFMHARGGLSVPYLSEEWMHKIKLCIESGAKLKMNSWAYDENGWPSGFGGGLVNNLGEKYQQKYLRRRTIQSVDLPKIDHCLGVFSIEHQILSQEEPLPDEIEVYFYELNPYYIDNLSPEVVKTFINLIYQKYYDEMNEKERSEMTGFFTDEPQISRNGIPWSKALSERYFQTYGEKLEKVLPELFFEIGNYRQTRCRFYRLLGLLFAESYHKQVYDWCGKHNWKLTGHNVLEESFNRQITSNGSVMANYQYYHIPGMDWLGRSIMPATTPLQVASVAAQTGKKQVLTETFACCGWNVNFADLKWMLQWQMVHGANLLCQHLESYTLRGIRKRDYPASIFFHQPWWDDFKIFVDYISRIGMLLAEGKHTEKVLVLTTISSAHMHFNYKYSDLERYKQKIHDIGDDYFEAYCKLIDELDARQINCHIGDESMMEEYGSVENGKLKIGEMSYDCVAIPKCANLSSKQVDLLEKFIAANGKVFRVENSLENHFYIDGRMVADFKAASRMANFATESDAAKAIATEFAAVKVNHPKINYTGREFSELGGAPGRLHYLVNTERFNEVDTEIRLSGKSVERFNASNGKIEPVYFEKFSDDGLKVPFKFAPGGDLLLISRDYPVPSAAKAETKFAPLKLENPWKLAEFSGNLLTLDYCEYHVDGEMKSPHEYVLSIQDKLLALKRPAQLQLIFTFETDKDFDLESETFLLLEHPERYQLKVNGTEIANQSCGFFADPAFEKIAIHPAIKSGKNRIELTTEFYQHPEVYAGIEASQVFEGERNKLSFDSEIEAVYLLGNFGVKTPGKFTELPKAAVRYHGDFILSKLPESFKLNNLEKQGLPFFAGKLSFESDFEVETLQDYQLEFPEPYSCHTLEILINGTSIGKKMWHDYRFFIPKNLIVKGRNKITVKIANSLRNLLGPHHLEEGESYGVGPVSFYKDPGVFAPNGTLPWHEDYCLVRFGINSDEKEHKSWEKPVIF